LLESSRWDQVKIEVNRGCFKSIHVTFDDDKRNKHQIIAIQQIERQFTSSMTESDVVNDETLKETVAIKKNDKLKIYQPTQSTIKRYYARAFPLGRVKIFLYCQLI